MTKVTITLQDGEFIARHSDHVGIIGVGDTEQEALQELAEALGALAFRVNKKDELLGLYRLQQEFQEKYSTEERLIQKMRCLDELREIKEELDALEKELKEGTV